MANALYPKGKAHIMGLTTQVDLDSDTIKVMLNDSAVNAYSSSHEFVSDLTGGGIVQRSSGLASKTVTSGTFDAADILLPGVTGLTIDSVIVYKDTGSDATSVLVCWLDVTPFSPTGGDITVIWSVSGIFAI